MKAFAFEESWEVIRQLLPADLEALARQSGSFQRARQVGDALTLLRLLLMHAAGLSLAQTALRAQEQGLGKLSAVALFKRLRRAGAFLQQLVGHFSKLLPLVGPRGAPAHGMVGVGTRAAQSVTAQPRAPPTLGAPATPLKGRGLPVPTGRRVF